MRGEHREPDSMFRYVSPEQRIPKDREAKLYRKSNGAESRLTYLGHLLIENRQGLIVDALATQADGHAEHDAGL